VLRLPDHWIWDSWLAAGDGGEHHLFFLRASRALPDPHQRHDRASIGHARSADLRRWELQADALVHAEPGAWDDFTVWTGSVARAPDGTWRLFYTGRRRADDGRIQRIGVAASDDLIEWARVGDGPILEADPRWYEKLDLGAWSEEAWRDPYVIGDPGGDGWHMLITARAPDGDPEGRGVIGHARSSDLVDWEIQPPLTRPSGFGHLEVPRAASIDGQPVLMFSCGPDHLGAARRAAWRGGGVWVAPGETLLGPWDLDNARPLAHPSLYAANFVRDGGGEWAVLGFYNIENGAFVGEISDPLPIERHGRTVRLAAA
jgi:beta-fructofuranosidase